MNIAIGYPAHPNHLDQIRKTLPNITVDSHDPTDLTDALCHSDIFCGHIRGPVDWDRVISSGKIRWIQSSAAGTDHCLPKQIVQSDILVSSASGVFANQVAEQTMALLLSLIRSLPTFFRQSTRKQFVRQPTDDLHGKNVGIIGFGGNGQRIAQVLEPFGCTIQATDLFADAISFDGVEIFSPDQLDIVLTNSDVVILTLPLTELTYEMFNEAKFLQMKTGAYFINVGRGSIVNEQALIGALDTTLAGAGLDVAPIEPLPVESPLWDHEKVVITPHVGAQSRHRIDDTTNLFCENLVRFANHQPLINLVDKSLGFPRAENRLIVGKR